MLKFHHVLAKWPEIAEMTKTAGYSIIRRAQ